MIGQTIRHYRIERRLGEGGMGVVYAARDLELDRDVAIKMIRADLADPRYRDRFRREARAAAQINHPNIGHLYEIGEEAGQVFIVMELLEGETLAERIAREPLSPGEATRVGLELLDALAALHAKGFVHRDVKPSNVFLLADGRVKLLDFGLVLPVGTDESAARGPALTQTGMVMGSPRYMSPEQIRGDRVDGRTDLFAVAALLHEALTGRPAFPGNDAVAVMYAVTNARVPELAGSPELDGVGAVLSRALAKQPEQRPESAETMAAALQAALLPTPSAGRPAPIERIVRLAVVPFRMLRPDPELDFLGPSLADAIAMSLAGIRSLVVRSPMAAARFAGPAPDLAEIARALDCDVVLFGTVLPAAQRCRVAAQLVEAPGGQVLWSQTSDAAGNDVFEVQDLLARRIVESLQLPLSARERSAFGSDVPANPIAYEFFLRANRSATIGNQLVVARDLYRRAVEADPGFAPAWVRLARCHRVLGKYGLGSDTDREFRSCEEALGRALELHPDMPSAHHVGAHFALDLGRVEEAMERLVRVVERNPNDPQGWSGLVAGFRYVGMLDESSAAYARARALEPGILTSYFHTLDSLGQYELALREPDSAFEFDQVRILAMLGREEEALQRATTLKSREQGTRLEVWMEVMEAAIHGDAEKARRAGERMEDFRDPEGVCVIARCRVHAGDHEGGLRMLTSAVDKGYSNVPLFQRDPWLEPIREHPAFGAALAKAEERHRAAIAAYRGKVSGLMAPLPAGAM